MKRNQKLNVAAIDMGSNSFHMIVAHLNEEGHLQIIDSFKETIRLGQGIAEEGDLSAKAITQAVSTLRTMKQIADSYGATIRAVATHAARSAHNQTALLSAIARKTGIQVEIIDGNEEARLIHLGLRSGLNVGEGTMLGVDVGGGSTEIMVGRGEEIPYVTSLKLGAVSLSERYAGFDSPTPTQIKKMRQHILHTLAPLPQELSLFSIGHAVASGGTAKALATIHYHMTSEDELADPNGYILEADILENIEKTLTKMPSPRKIRAAFGLERKRSEIVLAGAAILNSIGQILGVSRWTVSSHGFKEGIAIDTFARLGLFSTQNNLDVRRRSIAHFADRLGVDKTYASHIEKLALAVFDGIEAHFFPAPHRASVPLDNRELLEAAARLSEAGKFVSFTQYHKHSHYLISQSSLLGFSQEEKSLIGYIARYARKKIALRDAHKNNYYLKKNLQRVNVLSACLRLAKALNRSRLGRITDLKAGVAGGKLMLNIWYGGKNFPEVEHQALCREENSLSKAFGLAMEYEFDPAP